MRLGRRAHSVVCRLYHVLAGEADTYAITVSQADSLTKPSVEKNKIVFAALFTGTLPSPGSNCTGRIAWPKEIVASAGWVGSDAHIWTNGDMCRGVYDPPALKLLDPAHPDAVQPALGPPDTWAGKVDGWVSCRSTRARTVWWRSPRRSATGHTGGGAGVAVER